MAREWSELFITDESAAAGASADGAPDAREPRQRGGLLRRLRESMAKTRQALGSEIQATLFGVLDEHTWERLEEALIMADVGARTTASVVSTLETEASAGELEGGQALSERLIELLASTATVGEGRIDVRAQPTVIMAVGVNGTGKTTTIGKLAWHLREQLGASVLLAAADTYRAAAGEQLEGWAERAGCAIVTGAAGSDPGAVAFDALARARANSSASNGRRSSSCSPTPISFTGIPSSEAIASAIPPLAVPSSLVSTMPETSTASEKSLAWRRPFCPVVASTVSSVSCGAPGICLSITRRTLASSAIRLSWVCSRPAVSISTTSAPSRRAASIAS